MAHKVTAPLVAVKDPAGKITYFYEGATVPDGFDKDDVERLVESGMLEKVESDSSGSGSAPEIPEGDPSDSWTVKQMVAYAELHEIDLGGAKSKPDVLAKVAK
ncbi:hypothetical protein AB0N33_00800 [Pseudarthrobacter oxydans]|uniref:hypothetical protein n=1 Tax=Pseudarthrobacter oxydans TaxID=1671 RepID=UPI0034280F7D